MNFWIESDGDHVQKLDDTGETAVIFEIKLPFETYPSFHEVWKYKHVDFKYTIEEDFGDDSKSGYWDNFYYYSHESLEKIKMEILQ